jgi:CSLREA domain-containing protein
MKTVRTHTPSSNRLATSRWLSLALAALLALPPVVFTTTRAALAHAATAQSASASTSIVVNTTGDGDNVNANAGCDTDASVSGEQCSLRAAIQRANALAGNDTITFDIPTTQPNCVAATGRCTINLTKVLPSVSDTTFEGPGADKLTVRRDSGPNYSIFNVILGSGGGVIFRNLTISGGRTATGGSGAGISNGGANVTVEGCALTGDLASLNGGSIANQLGGTMIVKDSVLFNNGTLVGDGGAIYEAVKGGAVDDWLKRRRAALAGGL